MCKSDNVKVFKILASELEYRLSDFNMDNLYIYIMNDYGNISIHKGHINVYSLKDKQTMSYHIDDNRQLSLNGFIKLLGLNSLIGANKE